jgi:hypothetical protein
MDWTANALRGAQPPAQISGFRRTGFAVKRTVIKFWSVFFLIE